MKLEEAKKLLEENDYLVESYDYVQDFTGKVITPFTEVINDLKTGDIDTDAAIRKLEKIRSEMENTRNLLRAFRTIELMKNK